MTRGRNFLIRLIATGFYSGLSPLAPGTAGTAAALGLFLICQLFPGVLLSYGVLLILVAVGVPAASAMEVLLKKKDPGQVVVDEFAGFFTAVCLFPLFPRWSASFWLYVGLGFALFRIFDILKPFPIGRIQSLPGGWGIMADDLVAGAFSAPLAWGLCRLLIPS